VLTFERMTERSTFSRFAHGAARKAGKSGTFVAALGIVVAWGLLGPAFGFSDSWQLVINTSTTIVTFLMVFLIQHAQNTDNLAIQLKLNEIIRAQARAHNALMDVEELSEEELDEIQRHYREAARSARAKLRKGGKDFGSPDVDPKG
jgi:low affinity Fe/Cu permease